MLESCLPMLGIRNFIIGFCLSMFSVMLCGQLQSSAPSQTKKINQHAFKLSLFRDNPPNNRVALLPSSQIKKQSLKVSTHTLEASNSNMIDGIEDDEIISLNFNDQIPIEIEQSSSSFLPEVTAENKDLDRVASLPESSLSSTDNTQELDTPWVTAKTKKSNKNKKFEQLLNNQNTQLFTENIEQLTKDDATLSYKVAERIKQSIIFPIPDEILNDENLTPTFITKSKSHSIKNKDTKKEQNSTIDVVSTPKVSRQDKTFKKASSTTAKSEQVNKVSAEGDTSGILNSISSWFVQPKEDTANMAPPASVPAKKKKVAPSYNTNTSGSTAQKNTADELADFYSSLQETRQEYSHRKIIPSELELSFQPQKAEISGSTLTWLKTFSEAAINDGIYLQVRLDATASTELQRKRLNLLYTIFMNNGVDFNKVNTVFSAMQPNTFIIRTIRVK